MKNKEDTIRWIKEAKVMFNNKKQLLCLNWFECVVGGVHHPQHTQINSNSSTIAAGNNTV